MAIPFSTGQRLTADLLNTNVVPPDAAYDTETADETAWTNTTYDSGASVCGTTFTAPQGGSVMINWSARFQSNTANARAAVSVSVASGGSIGAGTVVSASNDDSAIETSQSTTGGAETRISASMFRYVTGLTPGLIYNVVVQKKMLSAGNGTIFQRDVLVVPLF